MSHRRDFLAQLGLLATALSVDADELRAAPTKTSSSSWDTSWLDALASAQYRVVFNASEIADGAAANLAEAFLDHYHEVHGTSDAQTRPVIVFRRVGVPMAFNDAVWNRYGVGEDLKINDPATHAFALRNIYWSSYDGASPQEAAMSLKVLRDRSLISLVCNIAMEHWATRTAKRVQRDKDEVIADVRANLIPGAILVPSGIYALIRAQNAGCAYMQGS